MTKLDPIAREMQAFDAKFDHINRREQGALICDPSCEQEYNLIDVRDSVESALTRIYQAGIEEGRNQTKK